MLRDMADKIKYPDNYTLTIDADELNLVLLRMSLLSRVFRAQMRDKRTKIVLFKYPYKNKEHLCKLTWKSAGFVDGEFRFTATFNAPLEILNRIREAYFYRYTGEITNDSN